MSTALNPFYDEEESEGEEDKELQLPDPCRTLEEAESDSHNNKRSQADQEKPLVSSELQPESEGCEDVLELELNQSEMEELDGHDGEGEEGEEDVEIIKMTVETNKKREVVQNKVVSSPESGEERSVGKLVQLNKPQSSRQRAGVSSGVLEVTEGKHRGLRAVFQVGCCYVWGYHLAKANLMYNLRAGDRFEVSLTLKEGVDVEEADVPLLVRKAWLGVKSELPVKSADNLDFAAWLIERNLSEEEFLLWLADKLPPKPFFPLKSELFEAKVIMLIRENPKGDGALVRITKEGAMKDNLAVFERDDFYLCGVHVGQADMRFLIKPGDLITVQIKEMSERERKSRCKKFPKLDEFEFNQTCLLAYIGEERPRGPSAKPQDNPELRTFLEQKGMSIEEFEKMRNISEEREISPGSLNIPPTSNMSNMSNMSWLLNPPLSLPILPHVIPPVMPGVPTAAPTISQMEKITKCNKLVAKAILMDESKRNKISELLSTEEEIELGYFIADMLTSSLVANVQNKVKAKLFSKMGSGAQETLNSMTRQLDMVKNQILVGSKPRPAEIIQVATNAAIAGTKPMSQAMAEAQQSTLAAIQAGSGSVNNINMVEAYDKQQQELRSEFPPNKGILAMSDMKKRLEAFKAAKKIDQKILNSERNKKIKETELPSPDIIEINDNDNSGGRWDKTEAAEEQGMDLLDLIRKYVRLQRKIVLSDDLKTVFFRELSFPSETLTKLKISKNPGEGVDHYTVGCLAYFLQNMNDDHPEYVRKCICQNMKCVRRPDRVNVQQYLTGKKDFVLNLDNEVSEYGSTSHRASEEIYRDTGRRTTRRLSRSRSSSRERSRSRSRRSRSRERRLESSEQFRPKEFSRMSDKNPRISNGESRFDQREDFDSRGNPNYFLSQQKNPYGHYQGYIEERERPVFSESRDPRPLRTEFSSYRECFAQHQGESSFDQIPTDYQPFGGSNNRDRGVNYSRHRSDLREGFFSGDQQYQPDLAEMKPHFAQERNFTAIAGYQKEDDLEYDRGFPLNGQSSDGDPGRKDPSVAKTLGPMFVIGQNNHPPGSGRRW